MDIMDIKEKIIECIVMVLKVDIDSIKNLSEDKSLRLVGMDSLNSVDIIVNIEQELNISFNDNELIMDNIDTMGKLVKIAGQKLAV